MKLSKKVLLGTTLSLMIFSSVNASANINTDEIAKLDPHPLISTYEPISKPTLQQVNPYSAGIDWDHKGWTNYDYNNGPIKQAECITIATNLDDPNDDVYHYSRARLEHYISGKSYGDSKRKWGYNKTEAKSGWGDRDIFVAHTYYGN